MSLTFDTLRRANLARLPRFKNRHGDLSHSEPDGSDWSPAEWLEAVVGELGEFANIAKKVRRGDYTREEAQPLLAKELADVQTYFDILALQWGVDLGAVTVAKFNEVSDRVGAGVYIIDGEVVIRDESSQRQLVMDFAPEAQPEIIYAKHVSVPLEDLRSECTADDLDITELSRKQAETSRHHIWTDIVIDHPDHGLLQYVFGEARTDSGTHEWGENLATGDSPDTMVECIPVVATEVTETRTVYKPLMISCNPETTNPDDVTEGGLADDGLL
jgi:hypothetical protein